MVAPTTTASSILHEIEFKLYGLTAFDLAEIFETLSIFFESVLEYQYGSNLSYSWSYCIMRSVDLKKIVTKICRQKIFLLAMRL